MIKTVYSFIFYPPPMLLALATDGGGSPLLLCLHSVPTRMAQPDSGQPAKSISTQRPGSCDPCFIASRLPPYPPSLKLFPTWPR